MLEVPRLNKLDNYLYIIYLNSNILKYLHNIFKYLRIYARLNIDQSADMYILVLFKLRNWRKRRIKT